MTATTTRAFRWGRPQVLRGAARQHFNAEAWSLDSLCAAFGDSPIVLSQLPRPHTPLAIGAVHTQQSTVRDYVRYLREAPHPTNEPLLYWGSQTLHNAPFDSLLDGFEPPPPFGREEDFLSRWQPLRLLAPPLVRFIFSFRWLFIGPAGSYSRLHVDPVGSAAWNACLHGRKRFVFYPPEAMHDLHIDLSDRTAERHVCPAYLHDPEAVGRPQDAIELLVEAGDVVYAPPRWPHFVENLSESCVSLTENFVRAEEEEFQHFAEALASAEDPSSGLPPSERRKMGRFRTLVNLAAAWDRQVHGIGS